MVTVLSGRVVRRAQRERAARDGGVTALGGHGGEARAGGRVGGS